MYRKLRGLRGLPDTLLIAQEKGAEWLRPAPAAVSFSGPAAGDALVLPREGQGEIGQNFIRLDFC